MRSSKSIIAIAAVLLAGGAGAWWLRAERTPHSGVVLRSADPRAGALPVMWAAPQFAFPDQDDDSVSTKSMRGKVWIVDFIFTHCASTCPKMTAQRIELQKRIADPRVMFLSISVDPERDDRATRKTYGQEQHLDQSRWRFVSPPDKQSAMKLAESMKIAAPGHGPDVILHSDRFILIDPQGRIRGLYPLADEGAMQRLAGDAMGLAKENTAAFN